MPWDDHKRRNELPKNWPHIRMLALRRDGFACRWVMSDDVSRCGAKATHVDHIIRGEDHSQANLQSLCEYHHNRKSAREGVEARKPRPSRRREREAHPGLL